MFGMLFYTRVVAVYVLPWFACFKTHTYRHILKYNAFSLPLLVCDWWSHSLWLVAAGRLCVDGASFFFLQFVCVCDAFLFSLSV